MHGESVQPELFDVLRVNIFYLYINKIILFFKYVKSILLNTFIIIWYFYRIYNGYFELIHSLISLLPIGVRYQRTRCILFNFLYLDEDDGSHP